MEYHRERERRLARRRRHNHWAIKRKRVGYWFGPSEYWESEKARLGRLLNTPHPCSKYCCGNPRKWFNETTRQERQAVYDEQDYA